MYVLCELVFWIGLDLEGGVARGRKEHRLREKTVGVSVVYS